MQNLDRETKHIDFPLSLKEIGEDGFFAGYASVFDVIDSHKDVIVKGAFARTLRENGGVKLLWQHHQDEPIGIFTKIEEDAKGLYVEGRILLDLRRGQEAYSLLKSGAIEGLSIGYNAVSYEIDEKNNIRVLQDIDLWEISLVTFPSNSQAEITRVKTSKKSAKMDELRIALDDAIRILSTV